MVRLSSFLDNDFYKFTMQQCVVKLFPKAKVKYQFINRGQHLFPEGFAEYLQDSVNSMTTLQLTPGEKSWLASTCPYLDPVYLDFLSGYRFNPAEVFISQKNGQLSILVEGPWYRTILWEVPLLCLVSENFYLGQVEGRESNETLIEKTRLKIEAYGNLGVTIAEFGTRRRYSFDVHDIVVKTLQHWGKTFVGTSNVHLAKTHETKPIGTHAHEWFMFHAAKYGFKMANTVALEHWVEVFRGDLGIALSDTFTTDEFYAVFDKKFAKLFDGVRHDSGDPLVFAEKTISHYQKFGIEPLSKTIIFSDALNFEKVKKIVAYCQGRIGISFGIGTNFTNDVGVKPLNIVMKMTEALPEAEPWTPVVKLSDEPAKNTGDSDTLVLAKKLLQITE
jgi:nicotinate phosphoribosyltransferase